MNIFDIPFDAMSGIHVAEGRILPTRHKHGEIFLLGGNHPAVLGIDLETLLEFRRIENPPEKLVREEPLALGISIRPFPQDDILDAAHGFHLGNAGVCDAIHVTRQEGLLIGWRQVAVMRDALVEVVRHKIEDVFLEVGSRANDAVDFSLANHFREGNSQLCRAHSSGEGHEHDSSLVQMLRVGFSGVLEGGGVEVSIMKVDELRYWALRHIG